MTAFAAVLAFAAVDAISLELKDFCDAGRKSLHAEKVHMTTSEHTNLVLYRCKAMNCVNQGQAFSTGALHSDLGGRESTDATIKAMVAAQLINLGANGTFVLTDTGASAISVLVPEKRRGHAKSGTWQSKRTVDQSA